jgi:hypothetical protein
MYEPQEAGYTRLVCRPCSRLAMLYVISGATACTNHAGQLANTERLNPFKGIFDRSTLFRVDHMPTKLLLWV